MKQQMNRFFFLLFIFNIFNQAALGAEWTRYKSPGEPYSFEMTGAPIEDTVYFNTTAGEIEYSMLVWKNDEVKMVFYYADFPTRYIQRTDIASIFNERRTAILRETGGRLGFEKNIFYESFGGRELMVELPKTNRDQEEPERVYARFYLVHDRFYELRITGYETKGFDKTVERFLTSFHLDQNNQTEIDRHLRYLGIDYKIDETQTYRLTLGIDKERSQMVVITILNTEVDNRPYFDIWSPVGSYKGQLSAEIGESLLVANSEIDLGSYQVIESEDGGKMMVFSVQVAGGMKVEVFKSLLIMVSRNADAMEQKLTSADQY